MFFFRFPTNSDQRLKWIAIIENVYTVQLRLNSMSKVCSHHFADGSYEHKQGSSQSKEKLKVDTSPSIFQTSFKGSTEYEFTIVPSEVSREIYSENSSLKRSVEPSDVVEPAESKKPPKG